MSEQRDTDRHPERDGRGNHISGPEPEMREVFGSYLAELAEFDDRLIVLDNDSDSTTCSNLFGERFPRRFLQMGIAEKNIFGTAAGLASVGYIPFPTVFATMATRCALDQITISTCHPNLNVKIPGHYVGGSKAGASHIPVEDLAVMRVLPNMKVADPASPDELRAVMRTAIDTEGPVYFRVSKLAHLPLAEPIDSFSWGRGHVLRAGRDVSLFCSGMMTAITLAAADQLAERSISAHVVHLPSIKPPDIELIAQSASLTGAGVTVENHSKLGGLGGAVAETLAEHCPIPLERIGLPDVWVDSAPVQQIFQRYRLRADDIATAAVGALARRDAMPARSTEGSLIT